MKLQRRFKLTVDSRRLYGAEQKPVVVENPYTIDFEVTRNNFSSSNHAVINVYNLSKSTRERIRYDFADIGLQVGRLVTLEVGYTGENLATIFYGQITSCKSVRNGVNFMTTIEANDIGWALKIPRYQNTWAAGKNYLEIVQNIIDSLKPYGVKPGYIDPVLAEKQILTDTAYDDDVYSILRNLTENRFYIDNGTANVFDMNRTQEGNIQELSSETGLIGTPDYYFNQIKISHIMLPDIRMSQRIKLKSRTFANDYNGDDYPWFKVIGITHSGMISDTAGGECTTELTLLGAYSLANISLGENAP